MRLAFKYRLFTNANQERELNIALETHRRLYNACLDLRELCWQTLGQSFSYEDCSIWFRGQRTTNPFFAHLNFSSAQATMKRLDRSFANFFRRVKIGEKPGYPRFKGHNHFDSFTFPSYGDGARLIGNRLRVQHVGMIRVKLHRPIEGRIKTITVKREADKWYVIASCEIPDVVIVPSALPPVGIDVGLTHFLTTNEGITEPNPRYLRTALPKLRRVSRSISRKKHRGNNRRKTVRKLQKIHARVKNLRREHHYQVSHRLVLAYGFIAVESLNIQEMLRNHRFSQAISDAGWASFLNVLHHKAEKAGVQYVEVDSRGTTQQCSECQAFVKKDITVRWHNCHHCGLYLDRDINAARNILARGLARTEPAGLKHNRCVAPRS